MKSGLRLLVIILVLGMYHHTAAQHLEGDSWQQVESNGGGTILVTYFPEDGFAYEDANGELTGITVGILRHFVNYVRNTRDVALNIEFVEETDFGQLYSSVEHGSGGVFGIANITITEERRDQVRFSPPYITNHGVLITHEDVSPLSSVSAIGREFNGKTGVLFSGTTHEDRILEIKESYFSDLETVLVHSDHEIVDLVSSGSEYFAYIDLFNYLIARRAGAPISQHSVADTPSEEFGIIMPLDSDWYPLIEEFFEMGREGYRNNSAYRNLLIRHLGSGVLSQLVRN